MTDRHSKAAGKELVTDPVERAKLEALNGLKQFDFVIEKIAEFTRAGSRFKLRPSLVAAIQAEALAGLSASAGQWRNVSIHIEGSGHKPPPHREVASLVEDLCDYVNDNWSVKTPIHLASYIMWRLNWIHPFEDGNGRTSRAVSYLVLATKLGYVLPGTKTIPDQISSSKNSYYEALEKADDACENGQINVSALETLISSALAAQLADIHLKAKGE
jgi:Fic family protein